MQLFISDLHLSEARPSTTAAYREFMRGRATDANTLWILGDLYEYWAGDDDLQTPFNAEVAGEIQRLSVAGVKVRLIVGNRDFLLGTRFAEATGAHIETDPIAVDIAGERTLLTHGDALCTDDASYQRFRSMVRDPAWQTQFLAQPLALRKKVAEDLRAQSEMSKQQKAHDIMDVNQAALEQLLEAHNAQQLIHGHTHRPALHRFGSPQPSLKRWVLADWHDQAEWLEAHDEHITAHGSAANRFSSPSK